MKPGLGDKIELRISNWILKFYETSYRAGKPKRLGGQKDGGKFDQFSGATITPRAL